MLETLQNPVTSQDQATTAVVRDATLEGSPKQLHRPLLPHTRVALLAETALCQLPEHERCVPAAITEASRLSCDSLQRSYEQFIFFLATIIRANLLVEVANLECDPRQISQDYASELQRELPSPDFGSLLQPETARSFGAARNAVIFAVEDLLAYVAATFDYLSAKGFVGQVRYCGPEYVEVTYGRESRRATELSRSTTEETSQSTKRGLLYHVRTDTTTTQHLKEVELRTSFENVTQRLIEPVACPLPYPRLRTPVRVRPLLASIPRWLAEDTTVITARRYDVRTSEKASEVSKHQTTTVEVHRQISREANRNTLRAVGKGAAYAATGTAIVAGGALLGIAAAAAVSALVASAPVTVPAAAAGTVLAATSTDPALVVGQRWCLTAWVPSELAAR